METVIEGRWKNGDGARLHIAPEGMTLLDSAGGVIGSVAYDDVAGVVADGRGRHGLIKVELETGAIWMLDRIHPLQARYGAELIQEQLSALHRRTLPVYAERQPFAAIQETVRSLLSGSNGVVNTVDFILTQAAHHGASDLHLEPTSAGLGVRLRVDGVLSDVARVPLLWLPRLLARLKVLGNLAVYRADLPQEGRFALRLKDRTVDVRLTLLPTLHGEKAVLRLFDPARTLMSLYRLGMAPDTRAAWDAILKRPQGLVLLTGPSNHGKTTTLYASLSRIHMERRDLANLCTVEDPIEYDLRVIHQTQVNPAVGLTFAAGLRTVLRQDPEVIMIGEIRDEETAGIAVRAGLTGHLILSSIHAPSAAGVFARLVDLGCEPFLVASSVTAVLAQRLVRRVCPECRAPDPDAAGEMAGYVDDSPYQWSRGAGCNACGGTGYRGRTGIFQLLEVTDAVRDAVIRGEATHELETRSEGISLVMDAMRKAAAGITTLDEVKRVLGWGPIGSAHEMEALRGWTQYRWIDELQEAGG